MLRTSESGDSTVIANELQVTDRLSVKLWVRNTDGIDNADFVKVFHRWIQKGEIGGLLIDVHDYSHVPNGPGVMLVAHEAHYRMDDTDGRLGLRYVRKREIDGDWSERLSMVLREALQAAQALESEPEFAGALQFDASVLNLRIDDRLVAPAGSETFAAFQPIIQSVVTNLYGDAAEISPDDTPGAPFGVKITSTGEPGIADLLTRLGSGQ